LAGFFRKKPNLPPLRILFMAVTSNDLFYSRLPVNEIPLGELLMEEHLFYKFPENWHVIITDVEGSSAAVNSGMHENVNLVATGSMVAVLNITYKAGITVPAFFGGDGATFIIPSTLLNSILSALRKHQQNTLNSFKLKLRAGHVPLTEIYSKGHQLAVSKLSKSRLFNIPVVLGDGLAYAEKIIKGESFHLLADITNNREDLDLSGMQCRWDTVKPPQNNNEVVSLLVQSTGINSQAAVFKKVIDTLDEIYGVQEKRKPISVPALRLKGTIRKLALEMRTRFGKYQPFYLAKIFMTSLFAPYYFNTKRGKNYLNQLVEMSDTLILDGKINTVISGSIEQRQNLLAVLDDLEKEGSLIYGYYVSEESVLSCYVRSLDESHIHFVDGAKGGYTQAAGMLKKKLKNLPPSI
jgi:hypothetical protein